MQDLFKTLSTIVESSTIIIDRPAGSAHPRFPDYIYPIDYGYLEGTKSQDGGGIDVWVGSGDRTEISGILVIADGLKRDSEIKIMLGCSQDEMKLALEKSNQGDMSAVLLSNIGGAE